MGVITVIVLIFSSV